MERVKHRIVPLHEIATGCARPGNTRATASTTRRGAFTAATARALATPGRSRGHTASAPSPPFTARARPPAHEHDRRRGWGLGRRDIPSTTRLSVTGRGAGTLQLCGYPARGRPPHADPKLLERRRGRRVPRGARLRRGTAGESPQGSEPDRRALRDRGFAETGRLPGGPPEDPHKSLVSAVPSPRPLAREPVVEVAIGSDDEAAQVVNDVGLRPLTPTTRGRSRCSALFVFRGGIRLWPARHRRAVTIGW